jgi:hypothetical protein
MELLKDAFFIVGGVVTVVAAWSAIKYQGIANAKTVAELKEDIKEERSTMWKRIDEMRDKDSDYEARLRQALDLDTAEKKFVSKELFDLRLKQFDLDLKENKHLNQATLDAVQSLTSLVNSMRKDLER